MNNKPTLEQCEAIGHLFPNADNSYWHSNEGHIFIAGESCLHDFDRVARCPNIEEMEDWLFDLGFRVVKWAKGKYEIQKRDGDCTCLDWMGAYKIFDADNMPQAYALACALVDEEEKCSNNAKNAKVLQK